jgi:hypothetical protein
MKSPLLFSLLIAFVCLAQAAPADEKTDAATVSTKAWLDLVDADKYKESWQDAAPFFKERVPEQTWVDAITSVRGPFGNVLSRELIGARYTKSLPGAPDGEYVVIQFKTAFQNKAEAIETITPMLTPDGAWKVSGYFVK